MTAQHTRRAATPRASRVDILLLAVKNHFSSVIVLICDVNIVTRKKFVEQLAAHEPQVTGEDEIVIRRRGIVRGKVTEYAAGSGWGKCQGYTIK